MPGMARSKLAGQEVRIAHAPNDACDRLAGKP